MTVETRPVVLIDLDFGDTDFVVTEHPDGMVAIVVNGERLLVNADQCREIVTELARVGREKGWLA